MIELFQIGDSPCCIKVRLVLAEQGFPWKEHFLKSRHPDQATAQDYLKRLTVPVGDTADQAAQKNYRCHMEGLEAAPAASGGPWIRRDMLTLADIRVAPIMDRIEYLDREHAQAELPGVEGWFAAVKDRPSYAEGGHPFDCRIWGPKKPVADHPYTGG